MTVIRILDFDGERGAQRFLLLRTALLQAGDGKGERSAPTIRKEARLLDALDAISDPTGPSSNGGDPDRILREACNLEISQEDFELLQQYAEKTPWTPRAARQAVDLWDWLSAAERQD